MRSSWICNPAILSRRRGLQIPSEHFLACEAKVLEIRQMEENISRSLQEVVGKKTYSVWVEMLRELVPDGRTHRLSVVVAGMLHHALEIAIKEKRGRYTEEKNSVAMSLIDAWEAGYSEYIKELIHDLVDRLFRDAGVSHERVSKRGDHYSIADETYNEFVCWYDYPWD